MRILVRHTYCLQLITYEFTLVRLNRGYLFHAYHCGKLKVQKGFKKGKGQMENLIYFFTY